MDLVLISETLHSTPVSRLKEYKRRLSAAKKRARYWSGEFKFHRNAYSVRRRHTLAPGANVQMAMAEIRELSQIICEMTGKPVKAFKPTKSIESIDFPMFSRVDKSQNSNFRISG